MTFLAYIAKAIVRIYQYGISPILPGACRYSPTCSQYAIQAIERFGPFKGSWMGVKRIFRCNPWGGSGFDPVPQKNESSSCGCGSHHSSK
ncbi:membrane protein insertion efficiency factor YidD [Candidatus Terasakiella magnetica]|uniref:membrane protein insertion efficiency factor YidD n=1 Tax=Candidatus Terasakiella magnetica TaxID=1867952 RepID=UPI0009F58976|nr:membrane protein insertion efficiency factor YidD [Candidatus Terasakiella magnetica]